MAPRDKYVKHLIRAAFSDMLQLIGETRHISVGKEAPSLVHTYSAGRRNTVCRTRSLVTTAVIATALSRQRKSFLCFVSLVWAIYLTMDSPLSGASEGAGALQPAQTSPRHRCHLLSLPL
ncbi:unnamed protein product [Pleuronectes platessa]|uniref:Uncharacterized protein n=1 Tax=Pleuronectes platessa TaxID=8262 RepID=A0A9N7VQT4_PLEPL|nr:unnamed protein product [Pleuronectes platessa]